MSILRMKGYCLSDTVLGILLQGSLRCVYLNILLGCVRKWWGSVQ